MGTITTSTVSNRSQGSWGGRLFHPGCTANFSEPSGLTNADTVARMMATVKSLIDESRLRSWAVADFRVGGTWRSDALDLRLERQARECGLQPTENRRGSGHLSALTPKTEEQAHPSSISAMVGLGKQPLHTDGAHQRTVPDFVLLWSETVSVTPTRIWEPKNIPRGSRSGVFIITSGQERWLASGWDDEGIRFDPGCMAPGDAFALQLSTVLQDPPEEEVELIYWDKPGKVLLLRNRRVLHGRAAVAEGDTDRCLQRIAFKGEIQ